MLTTGFIIFAVLLYLILTFQFPKFGIAVYILLLFLWPSYIVFVDESGHGINPQRIALLVVLVVWIVHLLFDPKYRSSLQYIINDNKYLFVAIALFFLIAIISGVLSRFDKSQAIFASFNQILFIPVTMLLVITYFNSIKSAKDMLIILVFLALLVEVMGIVEWYGQEHLLIDIINPATKYADAVLEGKMRNEDYRITTLFDNPLTYAQFLIFIFPISLFFAFNGETVLARSISIFQLSLLPFNIWATGSRAGMGLLLISLIMLIIIFTKVVTNKHKIKLFLVLVGGFLVALMFFDLGGELLRGSSYEEKISSNARVYQFERGLIAISESPVIGHGIFQANNFYEKISSTDNYYLSAAIEKGLLGLALLLYIQYSIFLLLKKAVLTECMDEQAVLGKYLFVSFLCLFAFELILSLVEVFSFSFIVLGAFLVISTRYSLQNEDFRKG